MRKMTPLSAESSRRLNDDSAEEERARLNSVSSLDSWEAVLDQKKTSQFYKPQPNLDDHTQASSRANGPKFYSPLSETQCRPSNVFSTNLKSTGNPLIYAKSNRLPNEQQIRTLAPVSVINSLENDHNLSRNPIFSHKTLPNASNSKSKSTFHYPVSYSNVATPIKPLVALQPSQKLERSRITTATGQKVLFKAAPVDNGRQELSDQAEKVKTKLLSVWNNMKYGWTVPTKTKFSYLSPIFLLGQCYQDTSEGFKHSYSGRMDSPMERFKLDFTSRIWLTYRRDFPIICGSNFTTDCGWGCMLRSGQMMLAQALVCHFLGRSWRCSGVPQTEKSEMLHRNIIRWFADYFTEMCPLSIHNLVDIGNSSGKKAGDWYGPASVSYMLKKVVETASQSSPLMDEICVYVAQDCTVYTEDVEKLCTFPCNVKKIETISSPSILPKAKYPPFSRPQRSVEEAITWSDAISVDERATNSENKSFKDIESPPLSPISRTWSNPSLQKYPNSLDELPSISNYGKIGQRSFPVGSSVDTMSGNNSDRWRGVIVLVPVRLGGERINPIYIPCLKRLLAHESSIGIIGGKPRHALYFVGYQEDRLIHLDPHYCQEAIDIRPADFPLNSFHCTVPKKIPLAKMDPSCTIGFYLRTRDDFERFVDNITPLLLPADQKLDYPIFGISPGSSSTVEISSFSNIPKDECEPEGRYTDSDSDLESENFVLL